MKGAPIPATLDLWSLGHSAGEVARMLDFPNHKHVARIVEHARSIRDPRAVLHAATNGRLIGRPGHQPMLAAVEVVPSIVALRRSVPKKNGRPIQEFCKAGHPRTAENVTPARQCRLCRAIQNKARVR